MSIIGPLCTSHDSSQGRTECVFDDGTPLEFLQDLLWQGPEEVPVDQNGRVITDPDMSRQTLQAQSADAANPFAPGFSSDKDTRGKKPGAGASGDGASSSPKAAFNPFAAPPGTGSEIGSASSSSVNPFALTPALTPAPAPTSASSIEISPAHVPQGQQSLPAATVGHLRNDDEGNAEHTSIHQENVIPLEEGDDHNGGIAREKSSASGSDAALSIASSTRPADAAAGGEAAGVDRSQERISNASPGSESASPRKPAFSFDDTVFRDAQRLFGPHLGGKSFVFRKQRLEIALRSPSSLRLGIWRAPVEEREEREREKEREKARPATVKPGDT